MELQVTSSVKLGMLTEEQGFASLLEFVFSTAAKRLKLLDET